MVHQPNVKYRGTTPKVDTGRLLADTFGMRMSHAQPLHEAQESAWPYKVSSMVSSSMLFLHRE